MSSARELETAIEADDLDRVDQIVRTQSDAAGYLNAVACHGTPSLARVRRVEMAARLLDFGADLDILSRWWAPGLFVNPGVDPAVGRFLVERGAVLTAHAAAGLGCVDLLEQLLDTDAGLVRAKGGDGCTPLHFARNVATASLLIERGADLNARDDDHDSTPAQWLIRAAPKVAEFLIERGANPDLFLAAALGNRPLAEQLVRADRSCLAHRIGKAPWHPIGFQGRGGTILQWTLQFNSYAHQIAAVRGHDELFDYLFAESDLATRFLVACLMANRPVAESLVTAHTGLTATMPAVDLELLARYCWETNASLEAVRLMLDCGFPVDFPETSHGFSPLHNAAWGGYADLVELLIQRGHPVELRDPTHHGTALDWAVHCCVHEGRHPDGEYGRVVGALLDAGSPWDQSIYPTKNAELDQELRQRL